MFSYAGGFSVHALANGAKKVTSLDISKQALELAKTSFQHACRISTPVGVAIIISLAA